MSLLQAELSPAITSSEVMLFAGAGASVPLGMPTTRAFLNELRRQVEATRLRVVYDAALDQLGNDADIERLLDILAQWRSYPLSSPPRLATGSPVAPSQPPPTAGTQAEVVDLYEAALRLITTRYSDVDADRARFLYGWLLIWLKGFCTNWSPLPIFTTNYDWTFERMVERLKRRITSLVDGFVANPAGSLWNPAAFHRLKGARHWQIVLFKLHGSTAWYRQPSGQIAKITHAERYSGQLKNVIVYPTEAKTELVREEPFLTAYSYLTACLSMGTRLCVVIGYSFRDPEISEAFRIGLAENPQLRIIVLDPDPDKGRLEKSLQCSPERMTFVKDEFRYYGVTSNDGLRRAVERLMTPNSIFHQPSPSHPAPSSRIDSAS